MTDEQMTVLDRLKFATNWLGCSSKSLRPSEIHLGGKLFKEGHAMLTGPDAPPIVKIDDIKIKQLKKSDNTFMFIYKEAK